MVKKLISIGVAAALLAMVVLPVGVAAADVVPTTYAKIPFAIVQSGFSMLGCLLPEVADILTAAGYGTVGGIDLAKVLGKAGPVLNTLGAWAGGPLAWSVDMLGWGLGAVECVLGYLSFVPSFVTDIVGCITDALKECYPSSVCNVSNVYHPC
jgi:hypothetical protein